MIWMAFHILCWHKDGFGVVRDRSPAKPGCFMAGETPDQYVALVLEYPAHFGEI